MADSPAFSWTPKRVAFCQEYLVDLCAADAARRAGYSLHSARDQGAQLLVLPEIRARIETLMNERAESTRIKSYKVLEELAVVAFSSIDHYAIDDDGHVSVVESAPDGAIRAVSSIKRKRRETKDRTTGDLTVEVETEIKLWDKGTATTNALKHLGMLTEKTEVTFPAGAGVLAVPVPVDAAQWGALAVAQQAALTARPGVVTPAGQ